LVSDLRIPRLSVYGLDSNNAPELIEKAAHASSMKPNPIVLTREELAETIERAR
jgi:hypothetical protein